jgi:hypothetical protein
MINRVFKVHSELSVDIGVTSFTVHTGDILVCNNEHIDYIEYKTAPLPATGLREDAVLKLNRAKLRVFSSIRVGNSHAWTPINKHIGKELIDITIQYRRDKLLNELF